MEKHFSGRSISRHVRVLISVIVSKNLQSKWWIAK